METYTVPDLRTPRILWSLPYQQAESDCACPNHGIAPTFTQAQFDGSGTWLRVASLYRSPLPDKHELVFNPLGQSGVIALNEPARQILDAFHIPQTVAEVVESLLTSDRSEVLRAIQQLASLGLLSSSLSLAPSCPTEPDTLTAWLHVTNACNLRCTYCYLHKTNSAMSEAVGRSAIESVFRSASRHQFHTVKLKYAGGEATLNFALVMKLHAYAKVLALESGLQLSEVILSNGVGLTGFMIDCMRSENVRLMISIDGIGASHDAQRMFGNGTGSFTQVSRSIDRALMGGLSPHLSITVTDHNVESLAEAVSFAIDRDLLFNINFFRENECAPSYDNLRASEAKLVSGIRRALAVIEARLPRYSLIGALVDRSSFSGPHNHACGAGNSYLVIDEGGGVARCQMEIERTVASVFVEDPLLAVSDVHEGFQNISVSDKEGCRDCEWRYSCAGGCPLLTFKATGRNDVKSPNCNIYKALYPEVLRLEGLRLLKWSNH
jgi:uncharacterized protein